MNNLSFEKARDTLTILGVHFSRDHGSLGCDLPFFMEVKLPFTSTVWCSLATREGEHYIGGCCGTLSSIQDTIQSVFRDSGWLRVKDLADIAQALSEHEWDTRSPNFVTLGDFDKAKKEFQEYDPWQQIAVIWHLVKDHWTPEVPSGQKNDASHIEKAVHILYRGMRYFSLHKVLESEHASESQKNSLRLMALHRLVPALKTVWEHIHQLNPGPLEGFALVDQENNSEIAFNGFGLCVYQTREEAESFLEKWRTDDAVRKEKREKPIDERIRIKPVRISVENGIEFVP